jgi:hypothetical protein
MGKRKRVSSSSLSSSSSFAIGEAKSEENGSAELSLYDIARRRHPICSCPSNPSVYFDKRCDEIATMQRASEQLRVVFAHPAPGALGIFYMPKEIIELCVLYYGERMETTIERTISDLARLRAQGGLKSLLTDLIGRALVSMRGRLTRLITIMDRRISTYLSWFALRRLIPLDISIHGIYEEVPIHCYDNMEQSKISGVCTDRYRIIGIRFNSARNLPLFQFRVRPQNWREVSVQEMIARPPFIANNLKMSPTWFSEIQTKTPLAAFLFFVSFATIQRWTSDAYNFSHLPKPLESQDICKAEWNRLYKHFGFGPPLSLLFLLGNDPFIERGRW